MVLIRTFTVGWLHFNTSVCFFNFHSFLFMKIVSFQLQRMKPVHLTTSIYNPPPPNIPLSVRAGPSSSFLACFPPSSCLPVLSLLLLEGGARGEERFLHTKAGPKVVSDVSLCLVARTYRTGAGGAPAPTAPSDAASALLAQLVFLEGTLRLRK